MSLNNRIRSLHETDEATAQAIMQEHPAQLDTDKLFKTTYQKFISLKNEQQEKEMTDSEFTEIFECSKEIKASLPFFFISSRNRLSKLPAENNITYSAFIFA